jgi:hypothetical protein
MIKPIAKNNTPPPQSPIEKCNILEHTTLHGRYFIYIYIYIYIYIMHRVPRVHHQRAQCISTLLFSADACRVTQVTHELRNFSCGLSTRHNIFYSDINGINVCGIAVNKAANYS